MAGHVDRAVTAVNRWLDACVRPEVPLAGRAVPAFRLCAFAGVGLAALLSVGLALQKGLALWITLAFLLAALCTFLILARFTRVLFGEERLILYHHQIAILLVTTAGLLWSGEPVLPYLDLSAVWLATVLAVGRIGCLMVGCCHGRPHRVGVCYHNAHVRSGFTPYYAGVRLFPVQAIESLWGFAIVAGGFRLVLNGPPGTALAWYLVGYGIGRFLLEFLRGDPSRPYLLGCSEAQWTSVAAMTMTSGFEMAGLLPFAAWHLAAAAVAASVALTVAGMQCLRPPGRYRVLNPGHVREIAQAVRGATAALQAPVAVRSTSLGIAISAGSIAGGAERVEHYTLSCRGGGMTDRIAGSVAEVILVLRRPLRFAALLKGRHGVYHLVLRPPADLGSGPVGAP